jgi:hypothetical protein
MTNRQQLSDSSVDEIYIPELGGRSLLDRCFS